MYVPLSDMIAFTSSSLSVRSQSSFRGRMAVSLEMTSLLCRVSYVYDSSIATRPAHFLHSDIEQHVTRALHAKEFARYPDLIRLA